MRAFSLVALLATSSASADETVDRIRAAGYHQVHLMARGTVAVYQAVRGGHNFILGVAGASEPQVIGRADGAFRLAESSARVGKFLGGELLDVAVTLGWSNGMGGNSNTTHYLLRATAAGFEVACEFEGDSSGGMENVSHSSTTKVSLVRKEPLTFDVEQLRRESGSPFHGGGAPERPSRTRYTVPAEGRCKSHVQ